MQNNFTLCRDDFRSLGKEILSFLKRFLRRNQGREMRGDSIGRVGLFILWQWITPFQVVVDHPPFRWYQIR